MLDLVLPFVAPVPRWAKASVATVLAVGGAVALCWGDPVRVTVAVAAGAAGAAQVAHEVTASAQAVKDRARLETIRLTRRG